MKRSEIKVTVKLGDVLSAPYWEAWGKCVKSMVYEETAHNDRSR